VCNYDYSSVECVDRVGQRVNGFDICSQKVKRIEYQMNVDIY
jgi:hypothetical protein